MDSTLICSFYLVWRHAQRQQCIQVKWLPSQNIFCIWQSSVTEWRYMAWSEGSHLHRKVNPANEGLTGCWRWEDLYGLKQITGEFRKYRIQVGSLQSAWTKHRITFGASNVLFSCQALVRAEAARMELFIDIPFLGFERLSGLSSLFSPGE